MFVTVVVVPEMVIVMVRLAAFVVTLIVTGMPAHLARFTLLFGALVALIPPLPRLPTGLAGGCSSVGIPIAALLIASLVPALLASTSARDCSAFAERNERCRHQK